MPETLETQTQSRGACSQEYSQGCGHSCSLWLNFCHLWVQLRGRLTMLHVEHRTPAAASPPLA